MLLHTPVSCRAKPDCVPLVIFPGKSPPTPGCRCKSFHQWDIDSVTIVLPHLVIDNDLTDVYLNENLPDYICNAINSNVKANHGFLKHNSCLILKSQY